jgi:hypothetical protein
MHGNEARGLLRALNDGMLVETLQQIALRLSYGLR